jgi:hypothetical protein
MAVARPKPLEVSTKSLPKFISTTLVWQARLGGLLPSEPPTPLIDAKKFTRKEVYLDLRTRQGYSAPVIFESLPLVARAPASRATSLNSPGLMDPSEGQAQVPALILSVFHGRLDSHIVCRSFPTRSRLRRWRRCCAALNVFCTFSVGTRISDSHCRLWRWWQSNNTTQRDGLGHAEHGHGAGGWDGAVHGHGHQ